MIIRTGTERDLSEVSALWLSMVHEISPEFSPNLDWWFQETKEIIQSPEYIMMIGQEGDEIVGFSDGFMQLQPSMGKKVFYSRHTYIKPEYRHTQLMKYLYEGVRDFGLLNGSDTLLFCCNEVTFPLWSGHGYTQIERVMIGNLV